MLTMMCDITWNVPGCQHQTAVASLGTSLVISIGRGPASDILADAGTGAVDAAAVAVAVALAAVDGSTWLATGFFATVDVEGICSSTRYSSEDSERLASGSFLMNGCSSASAGVMRLDGSHSSIRLMKSMKTS
jgi:hypothetical protein